MIYLAIPMKRKMERQLIEQYEHLIEDILARINIGNYKTAVELATNPQMPSEVLGR